MVLNQTWADLEYLGMRKMQFTWVQTIFLTCHLMLIKDKRRNGNIMFVEVGNLCRHALARDMGNLYQIKSNKEKSWSGSQSKHIRVCFFILWFLFADKIDMLCLQKRWWRKWIRPITWAAGVGRHACKRAWCRWSRTRRKTGKWNPMFSQNISVVVILDFGQTWLISLINFSFHFIWKLIFLLSKRTWEMLPAILFN